jgi:hypothetical protein
VFGPFVELSQRWKDVITLLRLSRISAQTSATGAFWEMKKVEQSTSIFSVGIMFLGWGWGF